MKFDLDKTIPDLSGEPVVDPATDKPMTIRHAMRTALVAPSAAPISQSESLRRYDLAMGTLAEKGPAELTAEDVVLIKGALTVVFAPLVAGAAARALDTPLAEKAAR